MTQLGYYSRQHFEVNRPWSYIDSGYMGTLGYAFPTALGAKVGVPDRPVICIVGDGGFMYASGELSTAVKYGINLVTVVFNDGAYGNVARDLDQDFGGTYEGGFRQPGFRGDGEGLRRGGLFGDKSRRAYDGDTVRGGCRRTEHR